MFIPFSPDPAPPHLQRGEAAPDHGWVPPAHPLQELPRGSLCDWAGEGLPGCVHLPAQTLPARYWAWQSVLGISAVLQAEPWGALLPHVGFGREQDQNQLPAPGTQGAELCGAGHWLPNQTQSWEPTRKMERDYLQEPGVTDSH